MLTQQPKGHQDCPSPLEPHAEDMAILHMLGAGPEDGEEGPTQHSSLSNSFMECWETLHRLSGPPFPDYRISGCFAPSQPLLSTGGCVTCWKPDRCGVTVAIMLFGVAQARNEEGAGTQAHEVRWRAIPVPKGHQNATGQQQPEKGPSALLTLLLPQYDIFLATEPPSARRDKFSHMHHHHSDLLMLQATSLSSILSATGAPYPLPPLKSTRNF